jgi:arsenical pump membrane protein
LVLFFKKEPLPFFSLPDYPMTPPPPAAWVAAATALGIVLRPWRLPEALWAVLGAALLLALRALTPTEAWHGVLAGTDVYLFLTGMMLLAEIARQNGVFDWLAAHAANAAGGSAARLFNLVYLAGVAVTIFLSNDATAVVLTPAVAAVARAAGAPALPYVMVCAFVANAASFVLPISNPANLVLFGGAMPALAIWLPRFALPSLASILATFLCLRLTQRAALRAPIATHVPAPALSQAGRWALAGIGLTAVSVLGASAAGWQLGWPTCTASCLTAAAVLLAGRGSARALALGLSWSVLPLVAGLFVEVAALEKSGLVGVLAGWLHHAGAAWGAGIGLGVISNLVNNLPAGLLAGAVSHAAHPPRDVTTAALIGVDLGPNLSVTGSLATILWLQALRRDGLHISAWDFLRLGLLIMPPALLVALALVG